MLEYMRYSPILPSLFLSHTHSQTHTHSLVQSLSLVNLIFLSFIDCLFALGLDKRERKYTVKPRYMQSYYLQFLIFAIRYMSICWNMPFNVSITICLLICKSEIFESPCNEENLCVINFLSSKLVPTKQGGRGRTEVLQGEKEI